MQQNRLQFHADREQAVKNLTRHLQLLVLETRDPRILQRISDGLLMVSGYPVALWFNCACGYCRLNFGLPPIQSQQLHLFLAPFFRGKKDDGLTMQLMQVRAQSNRQPPPLFALELVEVDQNRIKVC